MLWNDVSCLEPCNFEIIIRGKSSRPKTTASMIHFDEAETRTTVAILRADSRLALERFDLGIDRRRCILLAQAAGGMAASHG